MRTDTTTTPFAADGLRATRAVSKAGRMAETRVIFRDSEHADRFGRPAWFGMGLVTTYSDEDRRFSSRTYRFEINDAGMEHTRVIHGQPDPCPLPEQTRPVPRYSIPRLQALHAEFEQAAASAEIAPELHEWVTVRQAEVEAAR
ncbi:hypothetical protein [Leifsonia shinshuensis]